MKKAMQKFFNFLKSTFTLLIGLILIVAEFRVARMR